MGSEVATWTRPFLHELLEEIPKDVESLIDVGCGRGIVGAMTRIYRTPKRLVGVDIFQDYIFYLLQSEKFQNNMFSFINEAAQPNVGKSDFEKIYISVPSYKEQNKIAEILNEVDIKIENEQNYRSELNQLKKSLSQVLLTGQVRVKV